MIVAAIGACQEFDNSLRSHGGEVNLGKDLLSEAGGTLVERLAILDSDRIVTWHDTISVSVLDGEPKVQPGESRRVPRFMGGTSIPYAKGVEYICEVTFRDEFYEFRRVGLDPFLPREFGGPGFPCAPDRQIKAIKALRPQWVRALRVAMSQGSAGIGILLRLQAPWKSSASDGGKVIRETILQRIREEQEDWGDMLAWTDAAKTGLTIDEFEKEITALLEGALGVWLGFGENKCIPTSIGRVNEQLREEITIINRMVPSGRLCDPVRDLWEGLMKYLTNIRLGWFRLPQRYRTSPKMGTTMGYWRLGMKTTSGLYGYGERHVVRPRPSTEGCSSGESEDGRMEGALVVVNEKASKVRQVGTISDDEDVLVLGEPIARGRGLANQILGCVGGLGDQKEQMWESDSEVDFFVKRG